MPRSMVGLLTAVGTAMSVLAPSAHGILFLLTIAVAFAATGSAVCFGLPTTKKMLSRLLSEC